MAFDQAETFFGTGRTVANLKRGLSIGLLFELGFGLAFVTMWWWGPGDSFADLQPIYQAGYLVSPLIGLYFLYRFVRDALAVARTPLGEETEALWYVLDSEGLHIRHDLDGYAPAQITATAAGPEHFIPWSAMKSATPVPGMPPKVAIVRRFPDAVIDRTRTLTGGQRTRDGAAFEARLPLWVEAHRRSAGTPQMTGAMPPRRDNLREPR